MVKNCNTLLALTVDSSKLNQFVDFQVYNSFETIEQAKAAMQYEADLYEQEYGEKCEWLDDGYALRIPLGYNPNLVTTLYIDAGTQFHDSDEQVFVYQ